MIFNHQAYASLATLPPVYGLYAALVPFFMYAIFGTSKFLTVGMVAVNSIILASTLQGYAIEERVEIAILLSFLTGIFSLTFGLLGLGESIGLMII